MTVASGWNCSVVPAVSSSPTAAAGLTADSLTVTGAAVLGDSTSVGSSLTVTGSATVGTSLTVTGAAAVGTSLTVTGAAAVGASLTVTGAAAVTGALSTGAYKMVVLKGTGATGTAIRLTSDGAAAGAANIANIVNNSGTALAIDLLAFDHTSPTINESWNSWTGLMIRGANAAATTLQMSTTPTPITNGGTSALAGSAVAATADTTNGGLNLSFTPPTSNTDTWNVSAIVRLLPVS